MYYAASEKGSDKEAVRWRIICMILLYLCAVTGRARAGIAAPSLLIDASASDRTKFVNRIAGTGKCGKRRCSPVGDVKEIHGENTEETKNKSVKEEGGEEFERV